MKTAPTSIEVILRPALSQADEPSVTRHRYTHVLVYTAPGVCQAVTDPILDRARRCLTSVIELTPMS